jgi:hypothetical protein
MVAPCHAVISQKKIVLEIWKVKMKLENCTKAGKMYIKNGTYVNLNTWIFGIAVYSFIPENVQQLYLELDLKINFH